MRKLTIVTDSVLLTLKRKSENEIYSADIPTVMNIFTSFYPNHKNLNILSMRAVIAKDVEIVKTKTHKFCLILTTELDLLDETNAHIRATNKKTRFENKRRKAAALRRAISDPVNKPIIDAITEVANIMKSVRS